MTGASFSNTSRASKGFFSSHKINLIEVRQVVKIILDFLSKRSPTQFGEPWDFLKKIHSYLMWMTNLNIPEESNNLCLTIKMNKKIALRKREKKEVFKVASPVFSSPTIPAAFIRTTNKLGSLSAFVVLWTFSASFHGRLPVFNQN